MDNDNKYFYNPSQGVNPSPVHDAMQLPVTPAVAVKPEIKAPFKFTKKDTVFTILFFILSVIMVDFVMLHGLNLGFTISFVLMFIISTAYLIKKENKPSLFSLSCGVLSLAGSVTFTLYHDYFVNACMLLLVLGLFTIYVCGLSNTFTYREGSAKILINMLDGVFVKPFGNMGNISRAATSSYSKNKNIKSVALGLVVSIPVLIVVIPLLASSDAAFSGLISMTLKNIGIYVAEFAVGIIVAIYMTSYFIAKNKRLDVYEVKQSGRKGVIAPSVTTTFLSVISVTYVVYLFSQLAYFFSAFSGFLPEGYQFSASEYARRGFFEMFAICVINIVIITLAGMLSKRNEKGKIAGSIKGLSVFIILFSTLLLVTAMAKMKLNIEIFGLSKNRVMVSIFMIMMIVAIVFYVIHIFAPKFSYMQGVVIICSVIFISLAFCNIDGGIAKYNTEKYLAGEIKTVDVDYLYSLSDSAYPYIIKLADSEDHKVTKEVKHAVGRMLYDNYADYSNLVFVDNYTSQIIMYPFKDFREFNMAEQKSVKAVVDYYNALDSEGRKNLVHQYTMDEDDDYYYESDCDSYFKYDYDSNGYSYNNQYSYNEKSGCYEYVGTVDDSEEEL